MYISRTQLLAEREMSVRTNYRCYQM